MNSAEASAVFSGGVAVITGAASGIGAALAQQAALELNMRVVLADVARDRLAEVALDLRNAGAQVLAVPTDVADPAALERLAATTQEHFGAVKLLVNNAGIETLGWIWEIPAAQWDKIIDINIRGVVHGVRAFAPAMIASGEHCVIANLSSVGGISMTPFQASYVMSKHAVLSFTEGLCLEMAAIKSRVQVSAVLPGPIKTRIFLDTQAQVDPHIDEHRQLMLAMLEQNGMSPEAAAAIILQGLAAGDFWVSTHPELTAAMAAQRADYLAGQRRPAMWGEELFNSEG
jgi:NAD(P)-dependent dehydrogenase (short-subunit alcohol dehydrogenase family)